MSQQILPIHQEYVLDRMAKFMNCFENLYILRGNNVTKKNKIYIQFKSLLKKILVCSSYKKLLASEDVLYSYLIQITKLNEVYYQYNLDNLQTYLESKNINTEEIIAYIRIINHKEKLYNLEKIIFSKISNSENVEKKEIKKAVRTFILNLFKPIFIFEECFLELYDNFKTNNNTNLHIEKNDVRIVFKEKVNNRYIELRTINNIKKMAKSDYKSWCSYLYVLAQDIEICPYCASQYIYTYNVSRNENDIPNGTVRPELDHFIPQKKHPFLSMSVFNLIPSCHTCNSSIKGQTEYNHKYYFNLFTEEIESKFRFKIECNGDENEQMKVLLGNSDKFIITYDNLGETDEEKEKINYFLAFFHIEARYQYFKGFVQEFVFFRTNHSKSYINFLVNKFDITLDEDEYFIDAQFNKRLMGKLVDDINFQLQGSGFYLPNSI